MDRYQIYREGDPARKFYFYRRETYVDFSHSVKIQLENTIQSTGDNTISVILIISLK